MSEKTFDLVVIGAGPGGYVAAIRAAQLGGAVACVDSRATFGGTCLNVGCIPSKALLQSSELYAHAAHGMGAHGIETGAVSLDLKAMMARKDKIVGDLTKGIAYLLDKNKVEGIHGSATITGAGSVEVSLAAGGARTLKAARILIATGSEPMPLPGIEIDEERIVSSTVALELTRVPKHLVVIGGGYIGLELGSVWSRLGAKVTVVELLDRIVPGMDGEIAKGLRRTLAKQGLSFKLGSKVAAAGSEGRGVKMRIEPAAGGKAETLKADVVLCAVGRRPYTSGLGLEAVGLKTDNRGMIAVDARFETAVQGIHAIGDVIAGPMLAHKAEEDGIACVEIMAGQAEPRRLRPRARRRLHLARGRRGRAHRGRAQGGGHRLQGRQVSLNRQFPRPHHRRYRRIGQDPRDAGSDEVLGVTHRGPTPAR